MRIIHLSILFLILFQFICVCRSECKQYYVIFKQDVFHRFSIPFTASEENVIWDAIATASNNTISKECIIQLHGCSVIQQCLPIYKPSKIDGIHMTIIDNATTDRIETNVTTDDISYTTEKNDPIKNITSDITEDLVTNKTVKMDPITNLTSVAPEDITNTTEITYKKLTDFQTEEEASNRTQMDPFTNTTSVTTQDITNTTDLIRFTTERILYTPAKVDPIANVTTEYITNTSEKIIAGDDASNTTATITVDKDINTTETPSSKPPSQEVFNATEKQHTKHLPISEVTTPAPSNETYFKSLFLKHERNKKTAIIVAGVVAGSLGTAAVTYFIARKIEGLLKSDVYRFPE
ncbi:uncharacterized protein LOC126369419 [Pectinophora gossypiella]|uniref:uncharacterized protein LOC126369419 n=1 Tax=Pectinophora gossypiella TaxID=13191 RepID=UPI00214F5975|nr:uncharacterized protein LOC126369419 [Pectinophora gossypiella]